MIKRIETFLANIFRREISPVKNDLTATLAAITKLRGELAEAIGAIHARIEEVKTHTESVASELHEGITNHAHEVAADLHSKISSDAKAIVAFRQSARMACSRCGQMTWKYEIDKTAGKIRCSDCIEKGA